MDSEKEQSPEEHFNSRISTMQSIKEELVHLIKQNFTFKPKVLELGASSGELLYLLSDYSEKLIGIELNESFCEWGNNHLSPKIKMISDNINDVDFTDKFDLIISNYTLDHLTNPLETMKKLESVMSENGIMYLLVPNRDEALNYYSSPNTKGCYQTFFWHKAHMFYFTQEIFKMLLKKTALM